MYIVRVFTYNVGNFADQLHSLAWSAHVNARQIEESAEDMLQDTRIEGVCRGLEADLRKAIEAVAAVTSKQREILDRIAAKGDLAPARRPVGCSDTMFAPGAAPNVR